MDQRGARPWYPSIHSKFPPFPFEQTVVAPESTAAFLLLCLSIRALCNCELRVWWWCSTAVITSSTSLPPHVPY